MKAQIVSFHCVLKNNLGQVLSSSFNQDVINQFDHETPGGVDRTLRGLVAGIQNVRAGEKRNFTVPVSEAYGPYNPDLLISMSRSKFSKGDHLKVGSEVVLQSGGRGMPTNFRVVQIQGDSLKLDGNHPLAGQDLTFEIEVVSAREAEKEDFEETFPVPSSQYLH